jgi:hypothetical protein
MNYLDYLSRLVADSVEFAGCFLLDVIDDIRYLFEDARDILDPYLLGSPAWKVASWITKREAEVCGDFKVAAAKTWLFLYRNVGGRRLKFVRAPFWAIACWFSDKEDEVCGDLEELGWRIKEG